MDKRKILGDLSELSFVPAKAPIRYQAPTPPRIISKEETVARRRIFKMASSRDRKRAARRKAKRTKRRGRTEAKEVQV